MTAEKMYTLVLTDAELELISSALDEIRYTIESDEENEILCSIDDKVFNSCKQ